MTPAIWIFAALLILDRAEVRGLTGAKLDEAYPLHAKLTPTVLENLTRATAPCGRPPAQDFLGNEARSIRLTGRARRNGDTLRVGKAVFRDGDFPDDPGEYAYVGVYAGTGLDLVYVRSFEDDGFILVEPKSGRKVHFGGVPIPSPSGRYWASTAADDINWQGVEIAEYTAEVLRKRTQFDHLVVGEHPCGLIWDSNDRFRIEAGDPPGGLTVRRWKTSFRLESGKWREERPNPARS